MSTCAIYSPYWDTLGGGEKYLAAAAIVCRNNGYKVSIYWPTPTLIQDIQSRYEYDLSSISIDPNGYRLFQHGSLLQRYRYTRDLNAMIYVSDGSLPFLFSKKNIVHFQVPFTGIRYNPVTKQLKKKRIHTFFCNSKFTKKYVDQNLGVDSRVIYPPSTNVKPLTKKNLILSVGRFDNLMHDKRQDILIEAFQKLKSHNWEMVLAGGMLRHKNQLRSLQQRAQGFPITIITNPTWNELSKLYGQASIYWHAAGFGSNVSLYPQKAEHFGISTVEAMSAGAVPLVFNGGGLREIVTSEVNGYLWNHPENLISNTHNLMNHRVLLNKMSAHAIATSRQFSQEVFEHEFAKLIG
jgi:glycosyltransferase involved in cell wall biosynthesis